MRKATSNSQAPILSLADLSRNASVISTSSSDSGLPIPETPRRPRPVRTLTAPRNNSPNPKSPRNSVPPTYLTKELNIDKAENSSQSANKAHSRSKSRGRNVEANDFEFGELLGEGSYSEVRSATHKASARLFAIKILDKGHLMRKQKMNVALVEKNALVRLAAGHPGIVRLHYTFQDNWSLYFVLDIAQNGELQSLVSRMGSLSVPCTRYYTAQIVDAVSFMHEKGVIHRDLKPENLLLDKAFRLKITDFGTAQILGSNMEVEKFVGTAQYVAPELVEANETSKSSDLWALGCVVYQMICGKFAFHGLSEYLVLQKVKNMDYSFPDGFDSDAKDFVQKLLVRDPTQRLGAGESGSSTSPEALRAHIFFSLVSWDTLWTIDPPTLEVGTFKRQHPLAQEATQWNDLGAAWDNLVRSEEPAQDDDDIEWSDRPDSKMQPLSVAVPVPSSLKETSLLAPEADASSGSGSGSGTSSSTSPSLSPKDLASGIEGLKLEVTPVSSGSPSLSPQEQGRPSPERGRSQATTPIQGHEPELALPTVFSYTTGEKTIHSGTVEVKSLRRRASKLLPLSYKSPMEPKLRELVLTNRRLILFKRKKIPVDGGEVSIKLELQLPTTTKGLSDSKWRDNYKGDKLNGVQTKAGREFVIMSQTRSYTYAGTDAESASQWVQHIESAMKPNNTNTTN